MDSNLFKIDFDIIERVLADANALLVGKVKNLQEDVEHINFPLEADADVDKAAELLKRARELTKELSKARLSDGRAFSDAAKIIKNWFSAREDSVKRIVGTLSNGIENAERARRAIVTKTRVESTSSPIGESVSGDTVVQVVTKVSKKGLSEYPFPSGASRTRDPTNFGTSIV